MNELDLMVGAQVYCRDGKCGRLSKLAVEPDSWQVTHLIVEEGFLMKRSRVFPIDVVDQELASDIYLALGKDELAKYHEYQEHEVEEPVPGHSGGGMPGQVGGMTFDTAVRPAPTIRKKVRRGVSPKLYVIDRGVSIKNLEGTIGKLGHVFVRPGNGRITGVVTQQGLLFPKQQRFPMSVIERLDEQAIFVAVSPGELKELRTHDHEFKDLAGSVAVRTGADVQEDAGPQGSSPGRRVEAALMRDARTADAAIEVIEDRGVITLQGQVGSAEIRQAAEKVTANQPGVMSIVNALEVDSEWNEKARHTISRP